MIHEFLPPTPYRFCRKFVTFYLMVRTARGYRDPSVRQLGVFLQNHVGELADILRHLNKGSILVQAISVTDSVDFAVVRLIVDKVDRAREILSESGFALRESRILAVELPDPRTGLLEICRVLIHAEINIHYVYPMLTRPRGTEVVLIHTDEFDTASDVLRSQEFHLLDELDLRGVR